MCIKCVVYIECLLFCEGKKYLHGQQEIRTQSESRNNSRLAAEHISQPQPSDCTILSLTFLMLVIAN